MELSEIKGIFQSDLIIQSALDSMIKDLRKYPYLLDLVFNSLKLDPVFTKNNKGINYIDTAKKWFLKTNIPIFISPKIDDAKWPCITIELIESAEVENTLGDVNAEAPEAHSVTSWPNLSDSFAAVSYNPATGIIVLPSSLSDSIVIVDCMSIVDDTNIARELTVIDGQTIQISPVSATFNNAYIRGAKPLQIARLLTACFRETYRIGIHVNSESDRLSELYSVLVFALIRARKLILEPRGIERSSFAASDFQRNDVSDHELLFSRYINLTGYVRHYVVQDLEDTLQAVQTITQIIGGAHVPVPSGETLNDLVWIGDLDNPFSTQDLVNQCLAAGEPDPL